MMRVKNHQTPPTIRPDSDLWRRGVGGRTFFGGRIGSKKIREGFDRKYRWWRKKEEERKHSVSAGVSPQGGALTPVSFSSQQFLIKQRMMHVCVDQVSYPPPSSSLFWMKRAAGPQVTMVTSDALFFFACFVSGETDHQAAREQHPGESWGAS